MNSGTSQPGPLRLALLAGIVIALLFVLFGLPLPATLPKTNLLTGAHAPESVTALFARSCQDCHSDNTVWPWYARVAPLRWYMKRDVERARVALNLSAWESYPKERQIEYLKTFDLVARKHQMPPPAYILGHRYQGLSEKDHQLLDEWTRKEGERLMAAR